MIDDTAVERDTFEIGGFTARLVSGARACRVNVYVPRGNIPTPGKDLTLVPMFQMRGFGHRRLHMPAEAPEEAQIDVVTTPWWPATLKVEALFNAQQLVDVLKELGISPGVRAEDARDEA